MFIVYKLENISYNVLRTNSDLRLEMIITISKTRYFLLRCTFINTITPHVFLILNRGQIFKKTLLRKLMYTSMVCYSIYWYNFVYFTQCIFQWSFYQTSFLQNYIACWKRNTNNSNQWNKLNNFNPLWKLSLCNW